MITSVADEVVRGYVKEACDILNFDLEYVRVLYVSHVEAVAGIPQHAVITADGCLIIDETWANREISNETPTRVRCEVYCKVRLLCQQAKNATVFNQYDNRAIDDAMAFCNALMTLKGLTLPMPPFPQMVEPLLKQTQKLHASIKEGWWEEFCSDIYFFGGDGALYKDCLMKISKQEKYKWAFEK